MRFRLDDKIRLCAVELHRTTDAGAVIDQLKKHASAIEDGIFSSAFHHATANHVLSIHTDHNRLRNVVDRIRKGEFADFDRYEAGYHFASFTDMVEKGIHEAFYGVSGEKRKLFTPMQST